MRLRVEIVSVPDRDDVVAEIWENDAMIAELAYDEQKKLILELYPSEAGLQWRFALEEWIEVLNEARNRLED